VILEGLVTTINADGSAHISPMGPLVDESMTTLVLRPYQSSTTFQNLKRIRQGVLHVTDDVELLARAAVNRLDPLPALRRAKTVDGYIIADACRWYEFEVTSIDDSHDRATLTCTVVDRGRGRDFFGFNRAKHAVVEAAILATRLHILPAAEVTAEFRRLRVIVEKTGGPAEDEAMTFLERHAALTHPEGWDA
jgi:hypothetical protein